MTKHLTKALAATLPLLALGTLHAATPEAVTPGHQIKHVFIVVLENEGFDTTFGTASKAPYLSKTLVSQGAFLRQYYGTGHASLDNYIAMISGQAATNETRADCLNYNDVTMTGITPDGQVIGSGCIYPAQVKTVVDQLKSKGHTWRAYMEDMGNDPSRETSTCGHPALNSLDLTQSATKPTTLIPSGDAYATRHNPFAYFHSVIDSADCNLNVVNLNQMGQDLSSYDSTPEYVFITPNLCSDGHDAPCVDGRPGGLVTADAFLKQVVPMITASPAYQKDGLLMILFDEGGFDSTVPDGKGGYVISANGLFCCNQQAGPNIGKFPQSSTIGPYTLSYIAYGGDRTGAVLLSRFIKAGTVSDVPFNHYSMLKTVEDIFELDYLGYANAPGLQGFFGCATGALANSTKGQFQTCK